MGSEKVPYSDVGKFDIVQSENQTGSERIDINAQLSRKLDHKFDRHIVPWIFGIWQVLLHLYPSFLLIDHWEICCEL